MDATGWITLAVGVVIVPSVAWLVKEVLSLRVKITEIETRLNNTDGNASRLEDWMGQMQKEITAMGKNICRLCTKLGVQEKD